METPGRQARRDLGEPILDVADHGQRILAEPLQAMPETTSPSPFISVMPRRSSGVSSIACHVLEQHRDAALALDDDLLQDRTSS
jgi:hypothetical protein